MERERLLLVDDEQAILVALKRTFEAAGYEVAAFEDPVMAIEELRRTRFQVVTADYMMPSMSGAQFLQEARGIDPDAVRLLITAATDFRAAIEVVNRGEVWRIISKPWTRPELLSTVRQAFDHWALTEKNRALQRLVQLQNTELSVINTNLARLVQERTNNLLDGMIAALDYRDTETQWHSRRVSRFAKRLAEEAGFSGAELLAIEQGALLHDIGKIGVRDAILLKPGPLTGAEWEEMRMHPELGYRLLGRIDFLKSAARIVLEHQEKYDGTGYPQGLKGEAICVGARIFHLADTLDAITSDRPYRRSQAYDVARAEVERMSGSQFDPALVANFCRVPSDEWDRIRKAISSEAAQEERWEAEHRVKPVVPAA